MIDALLIVAANLAQIGLAFLLLGFLGWLWFQPGTPLGLGSSDRLVARLALYPILGWMLTLVTSSWLRVLAVPFRVSAPWLLLGLIALPALFLLWRLFRGRPALPVLLASWRSALGPGVVLGGILIAFSLVSINRLTVPALYDAGVWGYDQTNYVHIADQYLDRGMFEPADVPGDGVLAPWAAFNAGLVDNLRTGDPFFFSSNPDARSFTRSLGLIMRNGGAAMDATLASWFHLDGLQAYVLSGYVQYLLLILAGLWAALQMGVGLRAAVALGAFSGLWPLAIFPSLVDNRDQALAMVIVCVLLGSVFTRSLNVWTRGLVLAALALTYIELLPIAMFAWTLIRFDAPQSFRTSLKSLVGEGSIAFAVSIIYVPWGTQFLLSQAANSQTMAMSIPLGEHFGPLSNLAGTFAGIGVKSSGLFLGLAMVAGAAVIALQMLGLSVWLRERRYFSLGTFLFLAGLAIVFQLRGLPYASYKLFTVIFPLIILLCGSCLAWLSRAEPGEACIRIRWWRFERIVIVVVMFLCVPALALGAVIRSGFTVEGFKMVEGANSQLDDRAGASWKVGLKARSNDLLKARDISRGIPAEEGVALVNASQFDPVYFAHFLRDRPLKIYNGFAYNEQVSEQRQLFSSRQSFVGEGDLVRHVVVYSGPTDASGPPDPLGNLAFLQGSIGNATTGRTFASFSVPPDRETTFVQRIYSQSRQADFPTRDEAGPAFPFGTKGIALGVYSVNGPSKPRVLRFDAVPGAGVKPALFLQRARSWTCFVNGREAVGWSVAIEGDRARFQVPLPPSPAGNIVEIGTKDRLPIDRRSIFRVRPDWIQKSGAVSELVNFALEDKKE